MHFRLWMKAMLIVLAASVAVAQQTPPGDTAI
jgi:hypothetical protein